MIKPPNDTFEEFEFKAEHLNRYIEASGIFSILLKNGQIIHFIPKDVMSFKEWLTNHNISNIRDIEK